MSARRTSLFENTRVAQALDPAVVTADANGASADSRDYGENCVLFGIGESADTLSGSVMIECEVQESDNDSTWNAAPDADVSNTVTGTNVGTVAVIDAAAEDDVVVWAVYKGHKRYYRGVLNLTGTHTLGTPMGIWNVQGGALLEPEQQAV